MKALEKAAKDRVDARVEPVAEPVATTAAPPTKDELTLEPLAAEAPASSARTEPTQTRTPASRTPARSSSREQAQAATVLQASASAPKAGAVIYLRQHPVLLVATIAVLIAIGFGTYVYLQIFHPALFLPQPPIAPRKPPPPLAQAPAPGPPAAAPAPATTPLPATAPLFPDPTAIESATPPAPTATPTTPTATPTTSAPAREKPAAAPPPERAQPPQAAQVPRNTIVVSRGNATPVVNPLLTEAYAAFQANRFESAQRAYEQMLRAEPRNIDALLGLASIAAVGGKSDEAIRRYLQVLELEPRNTLAQTGLIGLLGRADPLAAETRLKQLIAREPSPFLYFTLGNLYADQSQWAPAQQAYFQAFHLDPSNPDYAYNLAVGLEHVSQPKLALGFYRRAVQLAGARQAQFNLAQAQERVSKLASQVE
ncbi:MAG TPA: tetratricopeptide repeat protein [Burkholderiales bacterium]|nr:tetratricopeptide repeat protein [Burkholderiales bacterium]